MQVKLSEGNEADLKEIVVATRRTITQEANLRIEQSILSDIRRSSLSEKGDKNQRVPRKQKK